MVGSWKLEIGGLELFLNILDHVMMVVVTTGHAVNQMTLFTMMMRWWQWYGPGNFGKEQKAQKCTILDRSKFSKFSWGPTLFRWLRRTRRFSSGCKISPSDLFVFHFPPNQDCFFPLLARLQRDQLQICHNSTELSPHWAQAWSHSIRGHPDYRCKVFIITINHYHFHNHIMIIRQHQPCLDQFDFIPWAAPRSCHRGWGWQKAPTLAHIGMLLQRYRESSLKNVLIFRTLVK